MSAFINLVILKRHTNGHAPELLPNSAEYTYLLASTASLAIELLSTLHARQCMSRIALEFDHAMGGQPWYTPRATNRRVIYPPTRVSSDRYHFSQEFLTY